MYTKQDVKEGAAWLGLGLGVWVALFVVIAVIAIPLSYIGWKAHVTSLTITAGDRVESTNLGTDNIINKQNYFYATDQDYVRYSNQIKLYQGRLVQDKQDHASAAQTQADRDGLVGSQQACLATATAYNGQAQNFNTGQFRSINLPAQLDTGACSQ